MSDNKKIGLSIYENRLIHYNSGYYDVINKPIDIEWIKPF